MNWNGGSYYSLSGGQPMGGRGGTVVWQWGTDKHAEYQASNGVFPRGGGGGRASGRYNAAWVAGGTGAAGRVYYRLKTT